MPTRRRPIPPRAGRTIWAALGFMVLFSLLVVLVSHFYLLPALKASAHATLAQRRKMAADAWLLLAVLLTILFCGLVLTFRVSRFFFPRPTDRRTRTPMFDAWAEAGQRAKPDDDDGPEGGDDEDDEEDRSV